MQWLKRNPVLAFTMFVSLYATALSQLDSQHLATGRVLAWLIFGGAVLTAALGLITHQVVTPVAAPRDNDGRALVPADSSVPELADADVPTQGAENRDL